MRTIAIVVMLAACGPSIVVQDDAGSTGEVVGTSETPPSVPPAMTSGPGPTPVTSGTDDGVDDGVDDGTTTVDGMDDDATAGVVEDDGSCGIFCPLDGGGAFFECDLFAQDCPKGEKCMPWANDGGSVWNATRCSPLQPDPALLGEPCQVEGSGVSGIDECDLGLMCWDVDEMGFGTCEDLCAGNLDAPICEDPDDQCSLGNGGALPLCLPACHPLVQDCSGGDGCYVVGEFWLCIPDASVGAGGFADPCDYINACAPGLVCTDASSIVAPPGVMPPPSCDVATGCCTAVCELGPVGDAACAALDPTLGCVPGYDPGFAPPGYEDVGICMTP